MNVAAPDEPGPDLGPEPGAALRPAGWSGSLLIRAWWDDDLRARLIGITPMSDGGEPAPDQVIVVSGVDAVCDAVRAWLSATGAGLPDPG